MESIVLFGGSGFVGTQLTRYLLDNTNIDTLWIADLVPPTQTDPRIRYRHVDIRTSIDPALFGPDPIGCIINLAAIHRSPGHNAHEYFQTNISGARNICTFANKNYVSRILFTSSISVYGPGEDEKTEDSVPMPEIPYGSSKIIAEYIHREWFNTPSSTPKSLVIVRPAVIFGKGEKGNFTRIAHALQKNFFVYPGRKDTIKGCVYVKDLCRFFDSARSFAPGIHMYNFCYPEKITIEQICTAFSTALQYPLPRFSIPLPLIKTTASILHAVSIPPITRIGIHPDRIMKLVRSTNISSQRLVTSGFTFKYDLLSAINDWAIDCESATLY